MAMTVYVVTDMNRGIVGVFSTSQNAQVAIADLHDPRINDVREIELDQYAKLIETPPRFERRMIGLDGRPSIVSD